LGILWLFILPLANTITWILLKSSGVVSVSSTGIPYPIFVFTGSMLWAIFIERLQSPLQKITANLGMLAKINFPREALVLSSIYQALFGAGAKIVVVIVGMALMGFNFLQLPFLLFPVSIVALIIVGSAIGLLFTPIGLLYR